MATTQQKVLIVLPHLIGAPAPVSHESAVPPGLAAAFAARSIAAAISIPSAIPTAGGFAHGVGRT